MHYPKEPLASTFRRITPSKSVASPSIINPADWFKTSRDNRVKDRVQARVQACVNRDRRNETNFVLAGP